jgi:HEAT repeat protein
MILAVWAVLSVLSLLVLRLIRERRMRRLAELRTRLKKNVSSLIAGSGGPADYERVAGQHGFTSVALDLLMELDGAPRARLVAMMRRRQVDGRLQQGLRRLNQAKRLAAAEALLFFPSPQTREALLAALRDRDLDVRLAAAASLVKQNAAPPLDELLPLLTRKGRGMPLRLGQILRDYGEHEPGAVIAAARDATLHPFIRAKAVETMAVVKGGRLMSALQSLVMSPEPDIRAAVLRSIGKAPSENSRDAVALCLRDQSWFVRAAAADAAGRLGLYELAPVIVPLVDDDLWWVRFRASEALERLDAVGRRALQEMAKHGSDRQKRQAGLALSKRVVA